MAGGDPGWIRSAILDAPRLLRRRRACAFLLDDGRNKTTLRLDRPDRALLLPPMLWHEMSDFSPDCVLLVVADLPFEEADYIRSYADFLNLAAR
jgi:hypothetical protein